MILGRFGRARVPAYARGGAERVPAGTRAVVAGGGLAGVAAATVLAERGASVTVVEREAFLGGRAGAWTDRLADGTEVQMERGFHAFFRQYYNLRELLRRVDPELSFLTPLSDYPLLGPSGARESFTDLPRRAPLNVVELVRRSPNLHARDLLRVDARAALTMLAYEVDATYLRWDRVTAGEYLDSLRFPEHARRMLFSVFSHSFFNPESGMSAAEMLMYFHFYFMGNPEGLVFDVMREPFSTAFWRPTRARLEAQGVRFLLERSVERVAPRPGGHHVHLDGGEVLDADAVVLALSVPALQEVVEASEGLGHERWRREIADLEVTLPFAVWRLWLDRPVDPSRPPFVGTAGLGILDNISVYERLEGESARWAEEHGGSVVELHAYAVPEDVGDDAVRAELLARLHELYPETRDAGIVEDRFLMRRDCPAFPPGGWSTRPEVVPPVPHLALAGDLVKTRFPTALMERAVATGFLAANHLLDRWNVRAEPLWSVPVRGDLAPLASVL